MTKTSISPYFKKHPIFLVSSWTCWSWFCCHFHSCSTSSYAFSSSSCSLYKISCCSWSWLSCSQLNFHAFSVPISLLSKSNASRLLPINRAAVSSSLLASWASVCNNWVPKLSRVCLACSLCCSECSCLCFAGLSLQLNTKSCISGRHYRSAENLHAKGTGTGLGFAKADLAGCLVEICWNCIEAKCWRYSQESHCGGGRLGRSATCSWRELEFQKGMMTMICEVC